MDLSQISPVLFFTALLMAATPILLAALGELVVERAGVLNLGVEGMMITGALCGFVAAVETGSPVLGFAAAALGGAALSMLFAFLTQVTLANQVASGLALTLFGLGLSALLGQSYIGEKPPAVDTIAVPLLSEIPFVGAVFFEQDLIVYFALLMVPAIWYVLQRTRPGMILRAVGENHDAAHALGHKVVRTRVLAIAFGGAMAGLGGGYLSLVRVVQWKEGITAGAGWIALALVVFASWRPQGVLLGAWLFGGVSVLQLNLQAAGTTIPTEYLSMSPYLATILVLVLISGDKTQAPGSLGRGFHASH